MSSSISASHWKKVCCSSFVHVVGGLGVQLCEPLPFVHVEKKACLPTVSYYSSLETETPLLATG